MEKNQNKKQIALKIEEHSLALLITQALLAVAYIVRLIRQMNRSDICAILLVSLFVEQVFMHKKPGIKKTPASIILIGVFAIIAIIDVFI